MHLNSARLVLLPRRFAMCRQGGIALIVVLVLALATGTAAAQERDWSVEVVPSVGWYSPTQPLGSGDLNGDAGLFSLSGGPSAGLALVVRPPTGFLAVRFGGLYSRPDLDIQTPAGLTSCGTDCFRANQRQTNVGQSSIGVATADLLFSLPKLGAVSPFAAVGAGLKRYHLAPNEASAASIFTDATSTDATGHLGVGLNLDTGRFRMTVEAGDYISKFSQRRVVRAGSGESSSVGPGQWQHDIAFNVGVAIEIR